MGTLTDIVLDEELPRARLGLLLQHFSELEDEREPWRVMYPLSEVLLLVTCATIASCDDFDDIVAWGEHHLGVLRRFSAFHHGIPCERWLRCLVNRVDPLLFGRCFQGWVEALWPGRHDLIAIDGKTARRTHDRGKGLKALHTLSAYATTARLVLAQTSVPEKANEITAIPELLDQLADAKQLAGALVTIDAMGCQADIAAKIVAHGADYLLALKGNQPTLEADVADYFRTAPAGETVVETTVEKGHGRIETRICTASGVVDWIASARSYPGQPRFTSIKTIVKLLARVEHANRCSFETRFYISSAPLDIDRLAAAARGHWGVESMHWLLDVAFKDDLSRYRAGHGAKNMAVVRRFALGLVRANKHKGSVKTRRKSASWNPNFLLEILQQK
ncbi:ISAs1 family transposase [Rhodoplanes roseus]|uniref:ISAs1 family transposase n=1 Tax=Rhodoplanes roseus TaxID=29409 RepID=A0A327KHR0_9BRAD|nr:ISAs1 family transposase [Rhodoplanes roseus]RAI36912.1 ISAs1 family transposase [Rhodoplanes roseus]